MVSIAINSCEWRAQSAIQNQGSLFLDLGRKRVDRDAYLFRQVAPWRRGCLTCLRWIRCEALWHSGRLIGPRCRWPLKFRFLSLVLPSFAFLLIQEVDQLVFHLIFLHSRALLSFFSLLFFVVASDKILGNGTLGLHFGLEELSYDLFLHSWLDPARKFEVRHLLCKGLHIEHLRVNQRYQVHMWAIDLHRLARLKAK